MKRQKNVFLLFVFGMLFIVPLASQQTSDFIFEPNETGITINGYKGSSKTVIIPSVIDGKNVTCINAFEYAELEEATIPSTVTKIGMYAFLDCSKLTKITIPSSVEEIEYGAFYGCDALSLSIKDEIEKRFGNLPFATPR
jgi:hypothetical protein